MMGGGTSCPAAAYRLAVTSQGSAAGSVPNKMLYCSLQVVKYTESGTVGYNEQYSEVRGVLKGTSGDLVTF
jgi:hypothetical protein